MQHFLSLKVRGWAGGVGQRRAWRVGERAGGVRYGWRVEGRLEVLGFGGLRTG